MPIVHRIRKKTAENLRTHNEEKQLENLTLTLYIDRMKTEGNND